MLGSIELSEIDCVSIGEDLKMFFLYNFEQAKVRIGWLVLLDILFILIFGGYVELCLGFSHLDVLFFCVRLAQHSFAKFSHYSIGFVS